MSDGSWRFILDKPGELDSETVIIGGFRTAAGCGKGGGLLLAERGQGWRLTVEWVSDRKLDREVGSAYRLRVLGNRQLDRLRECDGYVASNS